MVKTLALNATAVARSVISLATAQTRRAAMAVTVEVVDSHPVERHGVFDVHRYLFSSLTAQCMIAHMMLSYTCGGVGHLSRDCVQGSKCYNCSGIVRLRPIFAFDMEHQFTLPFI